MSSLAHLNTLHARLSAQQRALLIQAAESKTLPASGALRQIAGLEGTLMALDAILAANSNDQPAARDSTPTQPQARGLHTDATGTVKWFNLAKRFGFIIPDDGGADVFVHLSEVEQAGMAMLHEGQPVNYSLHENQKTGRTSAVHLRAVE